MTGPHPNPLRHRAPAVVAAALCLGATLLVARQNAMRGYPDGHLTRFEACMDPGLALLPPALGLAALVFVLVAIWPRHGRTASLLVALPVLAALGHVAVAALHRCRGLENGWGG
ncbi:hypothetical protein [Roseicyclus mahoneyensis]|uniref:Uncharacterized protein n=1 Tax=Roseicyclus mahoneyensis TaxID=164332 RepID=A0A316GL60_9RHOB|nr:hypothetical protein [Roseicyclus mahoneyensis]PWK61407.1 hypothetical protein C7455_10293 [Roseicyclus mahoneyensis]